MNRVDATTMAIRVRRETAEILDWINSKEFIDQIIEKGYNEDSVRRVVMLDLLDNAESRSWLLRSTILLHAGEVGTADQGNLLKALSKVALDADINAEIALERHQRLESGQDKAVPGDEVFKEHGL